MKKTYILLFASFFYCNVYSQSYDENKISYGIKGGLNIAKITGIVDILDPPFKSIVRPIIGVFGNYELNDQWSFQAEALFNGGGAVLEYRDDVTDKLIKDRFVGNSLSIPILARYTIKNYKPISLLFGPQISYLMSAKQVTDGKTYKADMSELVRADFSLNFGAEYNFGERFIFGSRYQLGMSKIFKDDPLGLNKNRIASFTVGYKIK